MNSSSPAIRDGLMSAPAQDSRIIRSTKSSRAPVVLADDAEADVFDDVPFSLALGPSARVVAMNPRAPRQARATNQTLFVRGRRRTTVMTDLLGGGRPRIGRARRPARTRIPLTLRYDSRRGVVKGIR